MSQPALPPEHTPITVAPLAFASCTANEPTPPLALRISSVWPEPSCPCVNSPCHAVSPASGIAAASAKEAVAGFVATFHDLTATNAAQQPAPIFSSALSGCASPMSQAARVNANTSSPTLSLSPALGPTASTMPAASQPGTIGSACGHA